MNVTRVADGGGHDGFVVDRLRRRRRAARGGTSRQDQITLLRGSAIIALGYGVGAALQSTYVYANLVPEWESVSLGSRLAANATAVVVLIAVLAAVQAHRARRWWLKILAVLGAAAAAGIARYLAQLVFGVYDEPDRRRRATRRCSAGSCSASSRPGSGCGR